jgi:hypothetical protein
MVGKPEVAPVGPIGNDKSASVELSRMLGSFPCIQTRLAVQSGSGKSANRKQSSSTMALEVIASVTKMSRKGRKTAAKMRQTTTNEGESGVREFAPTC